MVFAKVFAIVVADGSRQKVNALAISLVIKDVNPVTSLSMFSDFKLFVPSKRILLGEETLVREGNESKVRSGIPVTDPLAAPAI